MPSDRLVIVIK